MNLKPTASYAAIALAVPIAVLGVTPNVRAADVAES